MKQFWAMSKIPFFLDKPKKDISSIIYATRGKGDNRLWLSTGISVETKYWDSKKYRVRVRKEYTDSEVINQQLEGWEKLILETLNEFKIQLVVPTKDAFKKAIRDKLTLLNNNINNVVPKTEGVDDIFYTFLDERRVTDGRKIAVRVVIRAFKRFEMYKKRSFTLDTVTGEDIVQFERFLIDEHKLYKTNPELYDEVPENRPPAKRGKNRIAAMMKMLASLFNQAIKKKMITVSPFANYIKQQEVYGTPFFITIEERDMLYNFDLSENPALAIQRDIFIFHCLIGCRVGDLLKMTKDNVVDGSIEYIARKTKEEKPLTVSVPLSKKAQEILSRYPNVKDNRLLPFVNSCDYNAAIREMFTRAELNRIVTIVDTQTRNEVKKPLNEVASSHLARRTFIGNLYNKIKDPNLISSMSGHSEGSKAFNRYRAIDKDVKKSVIDEYLD